LQEHKQKKFNLWKLTLNRESQQKREELLH